MELKLAISDDSELKKDIHGIVAHEVRKLLKEDGHNLIATEIGKLCMLNNGEGSTTSLMATNSFLK